MELYDRFTSLIFYILHLPNPPISANLSFPKSPHRLHPQVCKSCPQGRHKASIAAIIARYATTDTAIVDNIPKNSDRLAHLILRLRLRSTLIKQLTCCIKDSDTSCPETKIQYQYLEGIRGIVNQHANRLWPGWEVVWRMGQEQVSLEERTLKEKRPCSGNSTRWPKVKVQSLRRLAE